MKIKLKITTRLLICAFAFSSGIFTPFTWAAEPVASLEGDIPKDIKELMRGVLGEAEDPPRSLAQARRRAEKAGESAKSVLRLQVFSGSGEGQSGAVIDWAIRRNISLRSRVQSDNDQSLALKWKRDF